MQPRRCRATVEAGRLGLAASAARALPSLRRYASVGRCREWVRFEPRPIDVDLRGVRSGAMASDGSRQA